MNTDAAAAFDRIAPFYDLDFEDYADDAAFYARLAAYHGSRVLELGSGTGRIALALARDGFHVTGVDVSERMIERSRACLDGLPPDAGSATFILADLRTLDLEDRFDLVCVPLGGFQHLETVDDLVAGMHCVARHLAPGGIAVVDVEAPHADDWNPAPQPLVEHWTRPWRDGPPAAAATSLVTKLVTIEPRPAEGARDITWHFDIAAPDGALRRVTAMFTLRFITPPELDLAGRLAGLRVAGLFGGYDFAPFSEAAERLIVLFQHAADDVEYTYLAGSDDLEDPAPPPPGDQRADPPR